MQRIYPLLFVFLWSTGFIGANFVHQVVAERPKVAVTVLDALTYAGSRESLESLRGGIRVVEGDLTDETLVDDLVENEECHVSRIWWRRRGFGV